MFKRTYPVVTGGQPSSMQTPYRWFRLASLSAALVLVTTGFALLGPDLQAGASTKTAVTAFEAKPALISWAGKTVTLSATVAHARTCTFSVTPRVKGLPVTKPCENGAVKQTAVIPGNTGTTQLTYTFGFSVTGTTTVKAQPARVYESDGLPGVPAGVWATPIGTTATVSFTRPSSAGRSAITGYTVTAVDATTSANGGQTQSATASPITLAGLTDGDSYTFRVTAMNASGRGPAATSNKAVVSSPLSDAISMASDYEGTCALLSTGGVDCWGDNSYGELGNGTIGGPDNMGYDTPQVVMGITDAVSITSDSDSVSNSDSYCAVLSTGGVECWGENGDGQLGNGTTGGPDGPSGPHSYDTPQAVSGITDAVSVTNDSDNSEGSYGFCALLSTGAVDCWGDNLDSQLGNGTTGGPEGLYGDRGYNTPQAVIGISDAVYVTSDGVGSCAVLSTGGVECWGDNTYGEIGNGTIGGPDGDHLVPNPAGGYNTPQEVTGITDAVSVSSGGDENGFDDYCALLSTGGVECWGINGFGQLGDGTVGGVDGCGYRPYYGHYCSDIPQAATGITDAVSISSGGDYCAVLSTGGVECWGDDSYGELGNGATGGYDTPQAVTGITDALSVTSGSNLERSCAVLSTGGVECWGDNTYGEIGNGTIGGPDGAGGYDTPQAVSGITDVVSVTSDTVDGNNDGTYCAVLETGGVDCWGSNAVGEVGNGTSGGPQHGYDTPQAVSSQ